MCLTRPVCFDTTPTRPLFLTYPPGPLLITYKAQNTLAGNLLDFNTSENSLNHSAKGSNQSALPENDPTSSSTINDSNCETDTSYSAESTSSKADIADITARPTRPSENIFFLREPSCITWLDLAAYPVQPPRGQHPANVDALDLAGFDFFGERNDQPADDDIFCTTPDDGPSEEEEAETSSEQGRCVTSADSDFLSEPTFEFPDEEEELELIIREEKERLAQRDLASTGSLSSRPCGDQVSPDTSYNSEQEIETLVQLEQEAEEGYQADTDEDALTEQMDEEQKEAYLSAPMWAPYENISLFPASTSTSPEVCKWAGYHYQDFLDLQADVWRDELSNDALRRYSTQCWAWTHVYPMSNWEEYLLPYRAFGYKRSPMPWYPGADGKGVIWEYPRGCKGRRHLSSLDTESEFYRPAGIRVHDPTEHTTSSSRGFFIPRPSRLRQVIYSTEDDFLLDELPYEEHAE